MTASSFPPSLQKCSVALELLWVGVLSFAPPPQTEIRLPALLAWTLLLQMATLTALGWGQLQSPGPVGKATEPMAVPVSSRKASKAHRGAGRTPWGLPEVWTWGSRNQLQNWSSGAEKPGAKPGGAAGLPSRGTHCSCCNHTVVSLIAMEESNFYILP